MQSRLIATILSALAALLVGACQPEIGDSCIADSECARDQVCDTTSPGGYCLQFDCDASSCPSGAVCVDFDIEGEGVVSACMQHCDKDSECRRRDGYVCRRDGPIPFCGLEP
jgi:hypothetical protein